MASSNVDFPAPVGPDIAKIPAEAKGSSVKSMENSPSSDRQIASSDRQHSHKETSLITSLNNVSISSGNSPPYSRQTYVSDIQRGYLLQTLYDKARSSASPSRRGYEGTMEVRRTAFPTNASSTRWRNVGSGSVSRTRIST